MLITLGGMSNDLMPDLKNELSPIVVNTEPSAIVTTERELQLEKAPVPIVSTEAGMDTDTRPVQHSANALSEMFVYSFGISTLPETSRGIAHSCASTTA
jgi:hypothetical protein